MFTKEEELVKTEFRRSFGSDADLLIEILKLFEILLLKTKTSLNEYNKYAAVILAGLNLKSIYSALDRLSKGYLSDSEAIFKKFIESFLAEVYLYEHTDKAKEWVEGTNLDRLGLNRREMAQALDRINEQRHIFPTDYPNFFEEYIYKVGYTNSNKVAHLDFDFVHKELGLEDDPAKFATTLVIGPKYDQAFMKTVILRLLMFTMFQVSYLKETFKLSYDNEHKSLLDSVVRRISAL